MEITEGVLRVAGVSHRSLSDRMLARVIPGIAEGGVLEAQLAGTGVPHVLLVTCNRLECYWLGESMAPDALINAWVSARVVDDEPWSLPRLHGSAALEHLVRVASGLESMLLGDTDVIGQVRRAWLTARTAAVTDRRLDRVFERVIHAARRVQHEVQPAALAPSVGVAAIEAIRTRLQGRWEDAMVAVVGSGAAATSALHAIAPQPPRALHLTGRTPERVAQLADKSGALAVGWAAREALIREADVTVFAVRSDHPLIGDDEAERILAHRGAATPVLWADLGMPPNVAVGRPVSSLQLLTLPVLMRGSPVSDEGAAREVVAREMLYLHAALHVRSQRPMSAVAGGRTVVR